MLRLAFEQKANYNVNEPDQTIEEPRTKVREPLRYAEQEEPRTKVREPYCYASR